MGSGFVCDFSNRTFRDFLIDSIQIDVYEGTKYSVDGESKAYRLRAFWKSEPNYVVAKATDEMIEYWKVQKALSANEPFFQYEPFSPTLYEECKKIISKLKEGGAIENADVLVPSTNDETFALLAKSIKEGIARNEPEAELDRLHTFVMMYVRALCDRHGITYDKSTPLNGLFGLYVKFLKTKNIFQSEMSEKVVKSAISILESFNHVRNEQSLAHGNPILNRAESTLVFNNIANTIRYISDIEKKLDANSPQSTEKDFPFHSMEEVMEELKAYEQQELDF